jgi:hypothetical protein
MSANPFVVQPGQKLLGEIVTWAAGTAAIRHLDVIQALRACGLDEAVARELAPRHAFARACRRLSDDRVIDVTGETQERITFQFTAKRREEGYVSYDFETLLALDKATGKVSCDLPHLAERAQAELDRCLTARTGGDVTRIVQRLFERQADLFPIRERGGAYFVPEKYAGFVNRVQGFLSLLGGRMARFPIPAGTPHGDASVRDTVAAGLRALIEEHHRAIAGFGEDTRPDTLERAAERIKQTRYKIEAYAAYLAEEKARLEREVAGAAEHLRHRVAEIAGKGTETPAVKPTEALISAVA